MGTIARITLPNRFPSALCNRLAVPAAAFSAVHRNIVSANPGFTSLTRAGAENAILHKKADSFVHPNYLGKFLIALKSAQPCCGTELVFLHSSGATRPFPTAIARFKDAYLMRVLANKADLVLDDSVSMQEIGAGIAHDTNNALTGVLSGIDLMGDQLKTLHLFFDKLAEAHDDQSMMEAFRDLPAASTALGNASNDLSSIEVSAGHLMSIFKGFGAFCSGTSKNAANEKFAVADAVKSSIAIGKGIVGRISKEKGLRIFLACAIPDAPLFAQGSLDGLQRVLLNLIKNAALEFKKPNNYIDVECSSEENAAKEKFVVIKVKDSGDLIPKNVADRLFREKVDSTHGGTGIGLLTSARMIHDFGGEIRHQSFPDKCFVIALRSTGS
jgi:signal transduction histidine kinase